MPQHDLPLSGVRVVELTHMVMGPTAGLILADLGADVIKVEPPVTGDKTRRLGGSGIGFFPMFSRNKKSIAVDLTTSQGQEFVNQLIRHSDVFLENFRPGAMDALNLDYETVQSINERIIYCSLKGFLAGPYENRLALDEVVQMMGGLAYMTGPPGQPLRAGSSVNDIMGGMFAVIGILAALRDREKTGVGDKVTSALFENNAFLVGQHMVQQMLSGKAPNPMPDRLSAWGVYDVFRSREGHQIFLAVVSDRQWPRFCNAFGIDELTENPDLSSNEDRVAHRSLIIPRIQRVLETMDLDGIVARCEEADVPYAPVNAPGDLYEDEHLRVSPGALMDVALPDGRQVEMPSLPIAIDGRRLNAGDRVADLGEHTTQVASWLGYDSATINNYVMQGILGSS